MIDSPGAIFYLYKVKSSNHNRLLLSFSERAGIRTPDNLIKSQVLYHLSYTPVTGPAGFEPASAGVKVLCLTAWRWPIIFMSWHRMRHGTFPRLRQSLNLWHPVICQSSHILPETFMISTLAMSIIKKMRAFLLAISFKYYKLKGGYRDSNPGPPEPQSGALTNCAIPTI